MATPPPIAYETATHIAVTETGNPPLGWLTGSQYEAQPTTSSPPAPTRTGGRGQNNGGDGINSPLYLFIFLAAVILLVVVAGVMVARAVLSRRRFHRRVQEAISRGETVPQYQNPFYTRPPARKKSKPLPPMPVIWESQMHRMDEKDMNAGVLDDAWFTPVSIHKIEPYVAPPPNPVQVPPTPTLRQELRDALSDMFPRLSRQSRLDAQRVGPPKPEPPVERRMPIVADAPGPGDDVRVGVLIAMPCEGPQLAMWAPDDPIDAEVPEVYVGVMECIVAEKH